MGQPPFSQSIPTRLSLGRPACHKNCLILRQVVRIKTPEANPPMTTPARSRKDSGKVTLIETIMFPLYLLLIVACVRWSVHRYGWRGTLVGLILVFIVIPLVAFGLGLLVSAVYSGMPSYPACRTGKCRSFNYQRRTFGQSGYALFCACGALYRKRGRRFYELQPDGSLRPYMVWRAFRGWFPDT
jgi:hypothetical protein